MIRIKLTGRCHISITGEIILASNSVFDGIDFLEEISGYDTSFRIIQK